MPITRDDASANVIGDVDTAHRLAGDWPCRHAWRRPGVRLPLSTSFQNKVVSDKHLKPNIILGVGLRGERAGESCP